MTMFLAWEALLGSATIRRLDEKPPLGEVEAAQDRFL